MIESLGLYGDAVDEWIASAAEVDTHWHGHPDDAPYPARPSTAVLLSSLQAAMLLAHNEDRLYLAQVDGFVRETLKSPSYWKTSRRVKFLTEEIRKWRDGSANGRAFSGRLRRRRNSVAD